MKTFPWNEIKNTEGEGVMRKNLFIMYLFVLILCPPPITSAFEGEMTVHFINVGQGDAILMETPLDKTILIDGGPPKAGEKVVSYLQEQGVETIDLIIATHPDKDHIGGLPQVMKRFNVKEILDTGKVHITKTYYQYTQEIRKQGIPVRLAEVNQEVPVDSSVQIEILNANKKVQSNNQSSIALHVNYGKVDFLLLSDIEKRQEKKMIEQKEIEAEILKIAHHGSKTSTSQRLLEAVNPQAAILTYSKNNKFGHPVPQVIDRLNETNALIYSTAAFGDIVIETNGEHYFITPSETPVESMLHHT